MSSSSILIGLDNSHGGSSFRGPAEASDVQLPANLCHSISRGVMAPIKLNVNGKINTIDVGLDTPLLWALRDALGLTGTKYGCGMGLCGACTVHLDGQAIRSCQTPVSSVAGRKVATVESLSHNNTHPLQVAWIKHDVPQCGYCQSGQLMSAAALLAKNKNPSDAQI